VHLPDSLTYSEYADSLGRFTIRYVPPGRYLLRGLIDANTNRVLDRRELFDSATVTVGDSINREMLAFVHDSVGPGIAEVQVQDSVTLRVTFDRPLQPRVPVTAAQFSLKAADSTVVPITSVTLGTIYEKQQADSARTKAVQDSIRQAQRADSIRRANPRAAPAPVPPTPAPAAPPTRRPGAAARDTTPPPKPSQPIPETYAIIKVGRPLAPLTSYRLHADSLRSLLGIARSSDRVFTTARTPPPRDTTKPPGRDTARPPVPTRRPPGADDLTALRIIRELFAPSQSAPEIPLGSRPVSLASRGPTRP
jgi:hypothetical protein